MGFPKFKELEFVYEYDFAVDGGSTASAKTLRCLNTNAMEAGLVIEELQVYVETAFAGTATPTCTVGIAGTTAGFMADIFALASEDAVIRNGTVAGSLLWDDTNDHEISYVIPDAASAIPLLTIATQALTAGKAKFVFKCKRYV